MRNQERPESRQIESGASSERRAFKWVRWLGAGVASAAVAVGLAACGSDAYANSGGASAIQEVGAGGAESGLGEESGSRLALTDTFDQVRAGARLVMAYDPASNTFVGAVENVTTDVLDRVRVEVHLSNGVELGPTTPLDLAPGDIVDVRLPATATPFDGWSPHAEVGSGGAEGSGEHGPGGESSEGAEGSETGLASEGPGASAGLGEESGSRLALTDTFDQVRAGARLVMAYDPASNAFVGTVENVTAGVLDRVRVEVHLSNGVELGPTTPVNLAPGQVVDVMLPATATPFDGWSPHAEVGSAGAEGSGEHGPGGEGSEGSEGSEGFMAGEGSGEHRATAAVKKAATGNAEGPEGFEAGEGAEGSEGGVGEESGSRLALTDVFDEVRTGARLVMAYDPASNAFVGAVENVTDDVLDRVRVEVHLSNGVELGPTNPVNLGPGEMAYVLLPATTTPFDGWSPHAEVGPSGAEGSGEHRSGGEGSEGGEGRERSGGHSGGEGREQSRGHGAERSGS